MPKIKTHSGAKKRFSLTKTGKVKRASTNRGHDIKGCKSPKRKRQLRKGAYAGPSIAPQIKRLIPYK
ncbi:MAG: 50S ribosomal protein L35 [Clostridiaceae bacterium]|nr:50S ribosomal protein L35 [Clostridiaceae bacterium]